MKRDIWSCWALAGACVLSGGIARAQQPADAPPPPPIMMLQAGIPGPGGPPEAFGEGVELLGFGGLHGGVVKNAPCIATATSEFTQTLTDGTQVTGHITRTTTTKLYRDRQGRVRKDVTISADGSGQSRSFTVISDVVAGKQWLLRPDQKVAYEMPSHLMKGGPKGLGQGGPGNRQWKGNAEANVQKKSLGTQPINGVSAEGMQFTRTIQVGNGQQITVVSERWYSSKYQMVVMSTHNDPRFGNSTYSVTSIQQQEQPVEMFTVPPGYTVKQGGGPRGTRRFRGGPPADAPALPPPSN